MSADRLRAENDDLRRRLEEAEETLRAIREGGVDAVVVHNSAGHRIFTLEGADRPYRLLVEQMPQAAVTLDADGRVVYCNLALADLLWVSHARLPATPLREFVAADDRPAYDRLLADAPARGGGEARLVRADGAAVPTFLSFNRLPPDCGAAVSVLVTDLTAQKHHERLTAAHVALRASEERFRTLFDSMDQGFCVIEVTFDPGGRATDYRLVELNPAFEGHSGLRDVLGRSIREAVPGLEDFWFDTYGRVAATGEPARFVHRAEVLGRWFEVYAFRLSDAGATRVAVLFTDVSERMKAEQAVRDSEAHFRNMADSAPSKLWVTDAAGRCTFISRRWCEYTGTTLAQNLGLGWLGCVHPDDRRQAEDIFRSATERHAPFRIDYRLRRHDGEYRWAVDLGHPRFEGGEFRGFVGSVTDIHDRRVAEDGWREAEGRYRTLFETMDEGFCVIEFLDGPHGPLSDYVHVEANPAYTTNAGIPDIVGQKVRQMVPDEAGAWVEVYRTVLLTGQPVRFERELVATGRHLELAAFRIGSAERRQVAVLFKDVTPRKRAEDLVREVGDRQRLLSEAAAVLLSTDDPDAMLRGVFDRIAPHFGLDAYFNYMVDDTGTGLRLASAAGLPAGGPPPRLEFGQAVCGSVAASRHPVHATHIQQSADPRVQLVKGFGVRVYACHPLLAGDRLLGTLSFASRTRDEFAPDEVGYLGTVCRYVAAAYERVRLLAELREQDRRKDEFLATLAHELRNPLAPVRTGLQVLKLAGVDGPAAERARAMMERQVAQMTHLIDDLMDLSRITCGKIVLQNARLPIATPIRTAVDTSRPLLDQQRHRLTLRVPDPPIHVDADNTRLTQVFANLLNNAAKYTEPGGDIRLTVERQGGEVVVAVSDTGVGISPAMLPRVFDMFSQVDRSLEKAQGGLGIGLNIVRRLVEMHGGAIAAESGGPGAGSTFTVRLPVAAAPAPPDRPADATNGKAKPPARRRILVVDDNTDGADSLAMMLGLMGNETRTAHDGLEAVDAAVAFLPDVILMDIGMPRLNGYEACRRIREQPWGGGPVIVACTGWGQEEDRRKSRDAGFNFHMTKPVDPSALEKLLDGLKATGG